MYRLVRNIVCFAAKLFYRYKIHDRENIPTEGKFIIFGNHMSNWDAVMLSAVTNRQIFFMAKKEMFENRLLGWLIRKVGAIPVNRDGNDARALKDALRVLSAGNLLGIFPQGTRSPKSDILNGTAKLKIGAAVIAIRTKTPLIPVYIDGYRLFHKNHIYVGSPFELSEYYATKPTDEQYQNITKEKLLGALRALWAENNQNEDHSR